MKNLLLTTKLMIAVLVTFSGEVYAQESTAPANDSTSTPSASIDQPIPNLGIRANTFDMGQPTEMQPNLVVRRGDYQSIAVRSGNPYGYIDNIVVTVRGRGTVNVLVNGRVRGSINGRLLVRRSVQIPVQAFTTSIEFMHVDGARMRIKRVVILPLNQNCYSAIFPNSMGMPGTGFPGTIGMPVPSSLGCGIMPIGTTPCFPAGADQAIQSILWIQNLTSWMQSMVDTDGLISLRKISTVSLVAQGVWGPNGSSNPRFIESAKLVVNEITSADAQIQKWLNTQNVQFYATQLLAQKESLKRALGIHN